MPTITGTNGDDKFLAGSDRDDWIYGLGGNDRINGRAGNDHIEGGTGNDYLNGGTGTDYYHFNKGWGHDIIEDAYRVDFGTKYLLIEGSYTANQYTVTTQGSDVKLFYKPSGDSITIKGFWNNNDVLYLHEKTYYSPGAPSGGGTIQGTEKADNLQGSLYADTIYGKGGNDKISGLDGNDYLTGGDGDDTVSGAAGNDKVFGNAGNDSLYGGDGNDTVDGGIGNDRIGGSSGKDLLIGGGGSDRFVFNEFDSGLGIAKRDVVKDFTKGDKVDLTNLDAVFNQSGNQAFTFIGTKDFTAKGQLRYEVQGTKTILQTNQDSDSSAETEFEFLGKVNFATSDFFL